MIMAGGVALLLVVVALAALFKIMRPEPASKSTGADFSKKLPQPEPLSAPEEAPALSREPGSHMFLPGNEPEDAAKPPDPTQPVAALPSAGESIIPTQRAAQKPPPKAKEGNARPKAKLNTRGFDGKTGSSGGGGGFGSFGGGGSSASPAGEGEDGPRVGLGGKPPPAGALGAEPAGAGGGRVSNQSRKRSMGIAGERAQQSAIKAVNPFKKDPKGERTSEEPSGVKPGWVKLDDGTVIYVLEMSGSVSEGGKEKTSGGGAVGGAGGTVGGGGAQPNLDQTAINVGGGTGR